MDQQKEFGSFRNKIDRKHVTEHVDFDNLVNPFNFYNLLQDEKLNVWLRQKGLFPKTIKCRKCDGAECKVMKRKKDISGESFRCKNNNNHEASVCRNSFFDSAKYTTQDIMAYLYEFILGSTMKRASYVCGVSYGRTSVEYNNFIREIFIEYVWKVQKTIKFRGIIEIDESLFGRKVKNNRGKDKNPKVWVFGKKLFTFSI